MAIAHDLPPLALYLHFPWCVAKCPYCDFNSYALREALPEDRYVAALAADLEAQAVTVEGRSVESVFLGGGTPSLFSPAAIARVLAAARRHLSVAEAAEVTLEANPGTVERGRFVEYRAAGVTRVSLGAQSFADGQLAALGRIHRAADTRMAAAELHAAGVPNFNLDLMYGLPGQSAEQAQADIDAALALAPAHLSHYHLTLEPGTPFGAEAPAGLPPEDEVEEMLERCQASLARAGLAQYEVSGYARSGARCRHNLNYWQFGDYLGVGAGAHGKISSLVGEAQGREPPALRIERTLHSREPRRYLAGGPGGLTRRQVPAADRPFEFMMNALRLVEGFSRNEYQSRTGLSWDSVAGVVEALGAQGLIAERGDACRPTSRGLRFLNDVLLRFLPTDQSRRAEPESQGSTRG